MNPHDSFQTTLGIYLHFLLIHWTDWSDGGVVREWFKSDKKDGDSEW